MATVQITQYASAFHMSGNVVVQMPRWPALASEIVDCSSAAAKTAAALRADCAFVRILAIGGAAHGVSAAQSATASATVDTNDERFAEGLPEFRAVNARDGLLGLHFISAS